MDTQFFILHLCKVLESNNEPIVLAHIEKCLESFDVEDYVIEETLKNLKILGYLTESDNGIFSLTETGRDKAGIIADRRQKDNYNQYMLKIWNSKAYLDFCEDLYGYRLCLLNSLFDEQYQYLYNELQISPDDVVLDIGCGTGAIISNIVNKYACKGIGIDFAQNLIAILREHYSGITFYAMDIEAIPHLPFDYDIIISLDSLYTCQNLTAAFAGLKSRCRRYMYLFYTQSVEDENGDRKVLQRDNTDIARALRHNNLNYSVIDFSSDEWNLWKKEKTILNKHRPAFEKEDNLSIWNGRVADTENMLKQFADKRAKRYLYKVEV